jgi:hypothetical protein
MTSNSKEVKSIIGIFGRNNTFIGFNAQIIYISLFKTLENYNPYCNLHNHTKYYSI